MRRTAPVKVGDLWDEFLKNSPTVARKLAEARVSEVWEGIVGPMVAFYTTSIVVDKGVLNVKISSASARSEVFMQRDALCDSINKAVGMRVINLVIIK